MNPLRRSQGNNEVRLEPVCQLYVEERPQTRAITPGCKKGEDLPRQGARLALVGGL